MKSEFFQKEVLCQDVLADLEATECPLSLSEVRELLSFWETAESGVSFKQWVDQLSKDELISIVA